MGPSVNKADRNLIIAIGVIAVIIVGGYASLVAYTGFTSPFSIVMSQSMQHDPDQSEIGCIDTGDIVIVRDPSKCEIYSYVEGTQNGHTSFGDYGSVIIYDRGSSQNPVIHRAIVWLEYDEANNRWSAPSLENYDGIWGCIVNGQKLQNPDWNNLQGTLFFENITSAGKTVYFDLNSLSDKSSGFLTMGDNPRTNTSFDQSSNIVDHLISYEDIRSVPVLEIPWLGTIKILINGGQNLENVPNSLPSLVMLIAVVFGFLILIDALSLCKNRIILGRKLEEELQWKR